MTQEIIFKVEDKSKLPDFKSFLNSDGNWKVANMSPQAYNYIMRIPVRDQDLWLASSNRSFKVSVLYSTKQFYTEDKSNINFEVEREK